VHALLDRLSGPKTRPGTCLLSAVITGSACEAGESFRRLAVAVRALRRELAGGYAEDGGRSGRRESNPHDQLGRLELYH
jgi:hypothetical protein